MHIYNESYLLTNEISEKIKKNILKFKKIKIIYYNPNELNHKKIYLEKCKKMQIFCKKNNIKFFVSNDYRLAVELNCAGIFLTNFKNNKNFTNQNKMFEIIGRAHNQSEYSFFKTQGCSTIMLSPIFYNKKYSLNRIINPIRFNLISNNWRTKVIALGGINLKNINKIKLLKKNTAIAFADLINQL